MRRHKRTNHTEIEMGPGCSNSSEYVYVYMCVKKRPYIPTNQTLTLPWVQVVVLCWMDDGCVHAYKNAAWQNEPNQILWWVNTVGLVLDVLLFEVWVNEQRTMISAAGWRFFLPTPQNATLLLIMLVHVTPTSSPGRRACTSLGKTRIRPPCKARTLSRPGYRSRIWAASGVTWHDMTRHDATYLHDEKKRNKQHTKKHKNTHTHIHTTKRRKQH